jgi:hypothetical protein
VPAGPVTPRGSGQLILFGVLAVTALALMAAAVSRLAVLNRMRRRGGYGVDAVAGLPSTPAPFGVNDPHP